MAAFNYFGKRWKSVAASVMRRDKYQCQLSKRYGRTVPAEVVHHIFPANDFPQWAYCPWNLISLSRAEHNRLHDRSGEQLTAAGIALMERTTPPPLR